MRRAFRFKLVDVKDCPELTKKQKTTRSTFSIFIEHLKKIKPGKALIVKGYLPTIRMNAYMAYKIGRINFKPFVRSKKRYGFGTAYIARHNDVTPLRKR